ncbi:MAG: insulinase family protein [Candidatus Gastranaerophilales bacterium]|nr:insulinase family protein [Candidatus Gastranaerophilales bacterium]MCM1072898.1 insulinase family protein [Bacteroides sp.]
MRETSVKYPFLTRDVKIYEQDNGHKIVLAYKEGGMVNVSSWVKTGSINENDKNNGISHFLEHLMFKGTHKHKAGEFDHILEARGAIVNAATWKDYTFYYVTLPKGENNENFNLAIELHADMMTDPVIPDYEMGAPFDVNDKNVTDKRERHVVIEEIRMRKDQPWTKVYNATNHAMYTSHPYKRDVIGTPEIISQVSQEEIINYYRTFYSPKNVTTIVVGEFDFDEVLEKVKKEFNWGERPEPPERNIQPDKPVGETVYIENTANINSAFMMFGYLGTPARDLRNLISLEMLSIILGEGTSSRLFVNLVENSDEPIFNMIDAENYAFRDGSNFFVQANINAQYKDKAVELIKAEIEKLKDGITERELNKARKKLKSRFASEVETVSEIGETIGYYMTVCDDLALAEEYIPICDSLTAKDLEETAKKFLNINNAVISVLIPET